MADNFLFTLTIDHIFFDENQLPRYPTLFDYGVNGLQSLQPELSLRKVQNIESPGGPFEIVFRLSEAEPARFAADSDGVLQLTNINNKPILGTAWTAFVDSEQRTCHLTWMSTETPSNQVLRLDCKSDGTPTAHPLALFFAFVDPQTLTERTTAAPQPLTGTNLSSIELDRHPQSDEFFYPMYRLEAYQQLSPAFRFEPALRIRHGEPLQFALTLTPQTGIRFRHQETRTDNMDEVPVEMPLTEIQAGKSEYLEPTLYTNPLRCIATWNDQAASSKPAGLFISFHLGIEPDPSITGDDAASEPLPRTMDPTIIEEPPAAPPVNGAKHDH